MAGGGGGGEGEPEFQIAPMIDVLLTLLIFFMSITSAQVEKLEKVDLPVAPDSQMRKVGQRQAIVNLRWENKEQKANITFDGRPYEDVEELKTALEAKRGTRTDMELLIRADKEVLAKDVQKIMQAAGMAGIDSVAYSTYNK